MQAIETEYKGYRFRSRLEARWAVFFDALGIYWEYEPEGYYVGGGYYYLPDFHLGGHDTNGDQINFYVEIKPENSITTYDEVQKMMRFAEQFNPGFAGGFLLCKGLPEVIKTYPCLTKGCQFLLWSYRKRPWWSDSYTAEDEILELYRLRSDYHMAKRGNWLEDYKKAVKKAKSARFEHGEKP